MDRKSYYKWLFLIGAFWNWGAGVLFFFWSAPILAWLNMQPLNYPGVMQLAMALVFALGVGYYWVSKNIHKNHDIVRLGIIAKTLAFLVLVYHYLVGNFHLLLALCGAVDLIFALLFIEFLKAVNKGEVQW
jgi:hypothetical protein